MNVLGVDIGGTGIKAAVVDTSTGMLLSERLRIPTPKPATPKRIRPVLAALASNFDWKGRIGCGFPGVIQKGVVFTAANVSRKWIGKPLDELTAKATGCSEVAAANDADAAGLAEVRFGAGREQEGLVVVLTLGTGIGSALFLDGKLIPNTELGHMEILGHEVEKWASERARKQDHLSWKQWAKRLNVLLTRLQTHLWPSRIILGGGGSKRHDQFMHHLKVRCEVVPAELGNTAGIVGAALMASEGWKV